MTQKNLYRVLISFLFIGITFPAYSFIKERTNKNQALIHEDRKSLFNVESHWNAGNIAVLIRHAERCDKSDNACLSGKHGITVPGANQAEELKKTYQQLASDNVTVYNSPIKRTDQTADIIFNDKSTDKKVLREHCKQDIYKDILALKEEGKNLILVTHSTCIDNLGEKENNKLFEFDIHDKSTYGGSFFLAVDAQKQELHALGYFPAEEVDHLLEFIE